MDAISWVCKFVAHWWGVLDHNSSQIQTVVGGLTLVITTFAFFMVLQQIKISITQTKQSQEQTKMLINERLFDLRFQLKAELRVHRKTIYNLMSKYNILYSKYKALNKPIKNKEDDSLIEVQRMVIDPQWDEIKQKRLDINRELKNIDTADIYYIEKKLMELIRDAINYDLLDDEVERFIRIVDKYLDVHQV